MSVRAEVNFAMLPEWLLYADVSPQALRLYAVLHRHADTAADSLTATPSRKKLAELMRVKERTVDRATTELMLAGALEKRPRWRDAEGTIYYKATPGADPTSNEYLLRMTPPSDRYVATPLDIDDARGSDTGVALTKERTLNESHFERESPPTPPFDTFWNTYPRRQGKRAARAAFEKALKRAPALDVIAGAERYARDPNRDPAFTAHASTWLNRDGWEDEPLPPRNGKTRDQAAEWLAAAKEVNGGAEAGTRPLGVLESGLPGA